MIERNSESRLSFIAPSIGLAFTVPGGCSSSPSMEEQMKAHGDQTGELDQRWYDGESMLEKGERLVSSGKKRIDDGCARIRKSERDMTRGKQLMARVR